MSADDDLHRLYGVPPDEFTALRKELAAAAKKRGDADTAKVIAAARRPTTAAWVLNRLVRADDTVRARLQELTDQLRSAHADMDGSRIRELTGAQRTLITELVGAALVAADIADPSAALREDVTGTLQAAIADREVAGRLGRLEKAERFSGFGDFGGVSESPAAARRPASKPEPSAPAKSEPNVSAGRLRAARKRRDVAAKSSAAAQSAAADAAEAVSDARGRAATARRRYEKILQTLSAAESEMTSATDELESAEKAATAASVSADGAVAELAEAEQALADLAD